jgi:hypothetical protein
LRISIVGISVHELGHSFLLLLLGIKLCFQFLSNDLLNQSCVIGFEGSSELRVISFQKSPLMGITGPNLLQLFYLLLDGLILLVVKHGVKHLPKGHLGCSVDILLQRGEKSIEQILIIVVEVASATDHSCRPGQGQHIVVRNSTFCQPSIVLVQLGAPKEEGLITHRDLALDL